MTKSELVHRLGQRHAHLSLRVIEKMVDAMFGEIAHGLAHGERIELRGFGTFGVRYREPRLARNPRTGEKVDVSGKYTPFFKAGKPLNERIN